MTKTNILNMSLRLLGAARITAITDSVEQARILNDVYDGILDEVLAAHPWNFALKRDTLTELGGEITTWTAQGTTNVWQATLTTQPAKVEFNNIVGTKKTSIATLTAANNWYWLSNILYVYSTSDPDTAYTDPGIEAIIAAFGYAHAYQLPTDCLRVVRMDGDEESDVSWVRESDRIFTDESTCKIQYIAQITDTTKFTPTFITCFAQRLAAEIAYPLTNSPQLAETSYNLYKDKLVAAKFTDAQEGTAQTIEEHSWITERG